MAVWLESERDKEIRVFLEERLDAVAAELRAKIENWGQSAQDPNELEIAVFATGADLEWALILMQRETLGTISDALSRHKRGEYGYCFVCGDKIGLERLRSSHLAVHCDDCDGARKAAFDRELRLRARHRGSLLFHT